MPCFGAKAQTNAEINFGINLNMVKKKTASTVFKNYCSVIYGISVMVDPIQLKVLYQLFRITVQFHLVWKKCK